MFELFNKSVLLSSLLMVSAATPIQGSPALTREPQVAQGRLPVKPRYQPMIGPIFEFADLQRLSGFERRADVERWATENGIPVKACRGGVWTTLAAVNLSLGISASRDSEGAYPPDAV